MFDVPDESTEHLSHERRCPDCIHSVHFLPCGEGCDCPPHTMPGSAA